MNRLKERTTATLLIAIFMISTFAVVIPVSAAVINVPGDYSTIQAAINAAAPYDTIIVAAGIYDEQVAITKSLTLEGAGDTTIIQPPAVELTDTSDIPWLYGGSHTMAAIVSVETTGGIVTVKNLKIDGSLIPSKSTTWVAGLVYLETSGTVEGVTVIGNPTLPDRTAGIFAAALTNTANLEVTGCTVEVYNRAGIYALGETITADYHHNAINGPGDSSVGVPNGMFFLEGATGSATYNTVTDLGYTGETYRSTGIGTYRPGPDLVFAHNEISYVQNAFAIAGGSGATIEYNYVHDCHTGIKLEAIGTNRASNVLIQFNDIMDNDFAIRCGGDMGDGNEAHYNNFVGNLGDMWIWGDTWIGAVCNVHTTYTLDAEYNWWGHSSGPDTVGPGSGDTVSTCVDYDPWLAAPYPSKVTGGGWFIDDTSRNEIHFGVQARGAFANYHDYGPVKGHGSFMDKDKGLKAILSIDQASLWVDYDGTGTYWVGLKGKARVYENNKKLQGTYDFWFAFAVHPDRTDRVYFQIYGLGYTYVVHGQLDLTGGGQVVFHQG